MAENVKCEYCEKEISKKEAHYMNGNPYCDLCINEFDFEDEDHDDDDDDDDNDDDDDDNDDDDDDD